VKLNAVCPSGRPWGADFPDPADFINTLFDPASSANFGHFSNPAFTRRMHQAARLSGERRLRAYARLDEDLTKDGPPAAAWGNGTVREFFCARVGCQTYQPDLPSGLGHRPRNHLPPTMTACPTGNQAP